MSAKNKIRGTQVETEVVKLAESVGLKAQRAWGSNGKALGFTENVDCVVDFINHFKLDNDKLKIQCKRKKKLPDYLVLDKLGVDYDAVVFRQDGRPIKHYIMMDFKQFLELIK